MKQVYPFDFDRHIKDITAILKAVLMDLPEKHRIASFKHQWERDPVTRLYVR